MIDEEKHSKFILKDDSYIKLPNSIYDDLSITNEEVTILCLLYRNYQLIKKISLCSIQMLAEYMCINTHNNRKIVKDIINIIDSLRKNNYITRLYNLQYDIIQSKDISDKNMLFYTEVIMPPEEQYFGIYEYELDEIFEAIKGANLNKYNIIRYFIACRRVCSNESNFGYITQGKMKQLINDSRTIQRYNTILQDELHLIRYSNDYLTAEKHYCTTFIGYWDDEKNFNHQLDFKVSEMKLVHTDKIQSNKKRSLKQKINHIESKDDVNQDLLKQLEMYKEKYGALNNYKPQDCNELDSSNEEEYESIFGGE